MEQLDLQIRQAGDVPPVIITNFSGASRQNQTQSTKKNWLQRVLNTLKVNL